VAAVTDPTNPNAVRVRLVGIDLDALPAIVLEPMPVPGGEDGRPLVDGAPVTVSLESRGRERALLRAGPQGDGHRLLLPTPEPEPGGLPGRPGVERQEVIVDGWRIEVEVENASRAELRDRARRGREAGGQSGPIRVHAIIPGVVVSVSIAPGDAVKAGQQLLVVEAMKMQNELRAPRDGTVEQVAVDAGARIDVGDLLLVLA
jgi:biotin carboxyl carrier protein